MAAEATLVPCEASDVQALEIAKPKRKAPAALWRAAWPRLTALGVVLVAWQLVVLSGWRPDYLLPGPSPVLRKLVEDAHDPGFYAGVGITLSRALRGYAVALALGALIGAAVARSRVLRAAIGSLISGLQSMPSIAWFPLAILLFGLSESAITFVVVLGAAPSIANGLIFGIDQVPPLLLSAGRSIGARRLTLFRHVLLPASLPSFIGGLRQGWAFAWRSLMAGELLVILAGRPSLGARLEFARQLSDAEALLATMLVILIIGMAADLGFSSLDRAVRRRWGLLS